MIFNNARSKELFNSLLLCMCRFSCLQLEVSIWYNCISDIQPILQFNDGISATGGYGLTMGVNNPNKISFFTGNDNWYGTNSNNQINGNWHNVVVALSAGNLNIYLPNIIVI